eukprot:TRINITY_DN4715_c0_g2_i1.p1 TRINITY_DN4715_c0_g2~~TRINITY_DN4715_c0_g2_i1.p1  ORF type:complete len:604 (+),score=111.91 TRINITY_DN4715_c0_g2_i1:107-1918(+)
MSHHHENVHQHHASTTHHEKANIVKIAEEGSLPSTERINTELNATSHFLAKQELKTGSHKHQQALHDTRELIEATQETLQSRNQGDKIQRLMRDMRKMSLRTGGTGQGDKISKEVAEFLNDLREFVMSLVKSPRFRSILINTLHLLRELVSYHRPKGVSDRLQTGFVDPKYSTTATAKETLNEVKSIVRQTKWQDLPAEHRSQLSLHFRELLSEISAQPKSIRAFKHFIRLISLLRVELYERGTSQKANRDVQKVEAQAKEIVEGFTGGRSLETLMDQLKICIKIIRNDHAMLETLYDFRIHVERGLDDPNIAGSQAYIHETESIFRRFRDLISDYYEVQVFYDVIDEAEILLDALKNDQMVDLLRHRVKRVIKDFTYTDSAGKAHLDMELVGHLRTLVIPYLIERVREIPIPRVQIQNNPDFEYIIIDDLFLTISEILPDQVHVRLYNDLNLDVVHMSSDKASSQLRIKIKGIHIVVKDFHFAFKRIKTITISDDGRADLFITRGGLDINAIFDVKTDKDGHVYVASRGVTVWVDKLKIGIREAKHKAMLKIGTTLFSGLIERQIERSLTEKLTELSHDLADRINSQVLTKFRVNMANLRRR